MESLTAQRIASLEPSATEEVDNAVKRMRRNGITDIVSLGAGEPCFDTPLNIKEAAIRALYEGQTKYQPTAGSYDLREEVRLKFWRDNHILTGIDEIIVTPGAKFAIYLALQAALEPGDRVLLLDPSWVSYEAIAHMAGARAVRVPSSPSNGFQPDLDAVRDALKGRVRFVIINSPCNPTGAVYNPDTIRTIVQLADERGIMVLSDEIYETLLFDGQTYSPASEFPNVVTVNGFSKSHAMTGWRLGYMTAPSDLCEGMLKIYQHSTSCVTAFAQAGAIEALSASASRQAQAEMVAGYEERRSLMLRLLAASEYLNCTTAQGAFYCFASYRTERNSVAIAKDLLEHAHVATVPGAAFGPCGEGHLRLSYASSLEDISIALERIEVYFQNRSEGSVD